MKGGESIWNINVFCSWRRLRFGVTYFCEKWSIDEENEVEWMTGKVIKFKFRDWEDREFWGMYIFGTITILHDPGFNPFMVLYEIVFIR